jgi:Domain of unknown function (DUF6362)
MNNVVRALAGADMLRSGMKSGVATAHAAAPCGLSAEEIVARLEAAGATLLAMPSQGYATQLRQMRFDIVHTALEAYGWQSARTRPPVPSAAAISAMDDAFGWLALPEARHVLRCILGARTLVYPLTGRHLYPWRRLAAQLGAEHKSVQRWHAQAVALLMQAALKA